MIVRPLRPATISQTAANKFVQAHHRHHKPVRGDYFREAAINAQGEIVGVVQVGRPVARAYNEKSMCEVTRLCTDGTRNACSFLYAQAAKLARKRGFQKIITYILIDEPGTSLKAAGWTHEANTKGGKWSCPSRPRATSAPTCKKQRWSKEL